MQTSAAATFEFYPSSVYKPAATEIASQSRRGGCLPFTSFSPSSSFQRVPCAQERDNGTGRASVGHISEALHFLASSILLTSQGEWRRLICSSLTLNVIYTGRAGCVNFHCEPDSPDQIIQSQPHRKQEGGEEGQKNRNPKVPYAENNNEEAFVAEKAAFIYSHHRYSNAS